MLKGNDSKNEIKRNLWKQIKFVRLHNSFNYHVSFLAVLPVGNLETDYKWTQVNQIDIWFGNRQHFILLYDFSEHFLNALFTTYLRWCLFNNFWIKCMSCDVQWFKLLFEVCEIIFYTFYVLISRGESETNMHKIATLEKSQSKFQHHKNISETVVKRTFPN